MTTGSLVLSRRLGESLNITDGAGKRAVLTVEHIGSRMVTVRLFAGATASRAIPLQACGSHPSQLAPPIELLPGLTVHLADIRGSQCKLKFVAPKSIKIWRSELEEKPSPQ